MGSAHLAVSGLIGARAERLLFTAIDFSLAPGEALQILGPNGSGKTTLLRILCGLLRPRAGQILWQGQSIHRGLSDYTAGLSYLGHRVAVKDRLTPREHLQVSLACGQTGSAVTVTTVLREVGLLGFEDTPCCALSSGQRQRVALARLFLLKKPLWILDEPFSSIDQAGVDALKTGMLAHVRAGGMLILATHRSIAWPTDAMQKIQLSTGVMAT